MTAASRASGFEVRKADWLEVHEAVARVLTAGAPLEAERIATSTAVGRALAEEVVATATLPPWDNSAMDGYAVRADDVRGATPSSPVTLTVTAIVRAGEEPSPEVGEGKAVRIMTGAPIPAGADTVIRVEDTDAEEQPGRVRIFLERDLGRHVRGAGQDMLDGESLFGPGHSVTAGALGVLVAAGRETVLVHRAPTVALLATGNELRAPDRYEDVRAGRGLPDSNGPMLSAMVEQVGAWPIDLGIAADDSEDLLRRIEAGAESDVLVTIGGASMGEADLVKRALDDVGYEQDFWRVKMRPGSPIGFGWIPHGDRRQPVFGLPGNPSSAFVTFEVFVRPFLLRIAGHRRVLRRTVTCLASEPLEAPAALTYFQRVSITSGPDGLWVALTGPQGSGLLTGLAKTEGLAVIPPGTKSVPEGDPVEVILLDAGPAALEAEVG
jgi:molybdopterin molybdotransferase